MKSIAIICMLIDHIGMLLLPQCLQMRLIGRIAMPIFAFSIARGSIYTSSLTRYIKRVFFFALVSQLPYWGMLSLADGLPFISMHLNIGFTFLFALLGIYAIGQISNGQWSRLKGFVCILMLVASAELLHCDYGSYGVLIVWSAYLLLKRGKSLWHLIWIYLILTLIHQGVGPGFIIQGFGVIGIFIIMTLKDVSERRLGKVFYIFYPLHMAILCVIKQLMG